MIHNVFTFKQVGGVVFFFFVFFFWCELNNFLDKGANPYRLALLPGSSSSPYAGSYVGGGSLSSDINVQILKAPG